MTRERRALSRKSKRKNHDATSKSSRAPGARGTTAETQASCRSLGGRRAGLVALLLASVFAVWTGWHWLHYRGRSEAGDKGNPAVTADDAPAGINAIRNVVLISIDTCRADHLSCYGYKRPTTPNIDAVARDGALFKTALTPVPLTTPAHSSMLTGTYPPTHQISLNTYGQLADSNVTLAKILREAGYQTAAFVGAFPLDARFGLNQGFDTYDGSFSDPSNKELWGRRAGEEVNRPALVWLDDHANQPFFLFLHYYDLHQPQQRHPPFTTPFADDHYAGEFAYVDNCIGRVLDRLRALGVYDNTLVIITGDHGESLGEHGELTHGYFIYQSTLRVPLVIRAPGCGKGLQVEGNVSLVDIVPTVLDLVGLKIPPRVEGVDLRSALEGGPAPDPQRAVYAESLEGTTYECSALHGVVEGPWKYIMTRRPELYDLSKDPGELTNLAGKEPRVAQRLRGRLGAMFKELERAASQRGPSAVDPEAIKRLQSLGYVGEGTTMPASAMDTTGEDPKDFLPTYNLLADARRKIREEVGRRDEVKKELLEIAARRPGLIMLQKLLAEIALDERRPADAATHFAKVVARLDKLKDPSKQLPGGLGELAWAHYNLASALDLEGNAAQAATHYAEAVRLQADLPGALNNLAWTRATSEDPRHRDGPEAVRLAQQACRLTGHREVNVLDTLAAAYAEAGLFAEAVQTARQALDLAKQQNKPGLAKSIQAKIRLYEAKKPFHESLSSPAKIPIRP